MKRIIKLALILLPIISFSQNEAAIWYFGQYAGLDFNTGTPVVLTDGQTDTYEGCATISDASGNLLFYTDGVFVWNRNHTIMPNGSGLLGDTSSTQSAIIVPKPNSTTIYYIFTVDDNPNSSSSNGINYSTVDISLDSGLGDVVISDKNTLLITNSYEKITATRHSDNNSYWIITFIQNQFYSWRLDSTGLSATPITTNVSSTNSSIGYLKASTNGSKIASANYGSSNPSLMLYDFNTTTGIVSNEQQLTLDAAADIPYGVEFSPQSTKLYVETDQQNFLGRTPPSKIVQYDLLSTNVATSGILIHTSSVNTRGALQLAIDGKIYRACSISYGLNQEGTPFLGVINNPEADGIACNYVHDAIDISNGDSFRNVVEGLPTFLPYFFLKPTISATTVCFGDTTQFTLDTYTTPDSISWDFGDPSTGINNSSNLENPTHLFSAPGNFTINVSIIIGTVTTNLSLDVTIYNLPIVTSPVTLIQCDDDLDGFVNFNLEEANSLISNETPTPTITYFLTEAEALTNTNPINTPTAFSNADSNLNTIWASIVNDASCTTTSQINLEVITTNIPTDLMVTFNECDNSTDGDNTNGITTFNFSNATSEILNTLLPETNLTVAYYLNIPDALAEQNSLDATNYTNTTSPTTQQIVVRVDNILNDCFGLGYHVTLNVTPAPSFSLASTAVLCLSSQNPTIKVENPLTTYNYVWTDEFDEVIGGNTVEITIYNEGLYTVTATDPNYDNCETTKSIEISAIQTTELLGFDSTNISKIDNSSNNTITVSTINLPVGNYEFALDTDAFQSNNTFTNVTAGIHTVTIRNLDTCQEASVKVSLIGVPNFFTPNGDGYNDTWQITGVSFQPNSNIYIYDRFGKMIAILDPLGDGWNGFYKGNPLPSTDYWYRIELEDGRILKGHFSLIR